MKPAAVPLACRDRLYALFADCLKDASEFAPKARLLGRERPAWKGYLDDRIRRYETALRACHTMLSSDPLSRDLRIGAALFNEGLFFDCHEYLEGAWRRAQGEEKVMLQGLVQAGAAFHKLELGSPAGCAELLEKAASKLSSLADPRWGYLRPFAAELARSGGSVVPRMPSS